jgi:hypothetical protein
VIGVRLRVELSRDEINELQYPVVVEMWEKVKGSLSKKRKYHEAFTYREREKISVYYKKFYDWHLRVGTPEATSMHPETLTLLKRAIDFFATI